MHYQVSRNGQMYGPYTLEDLQRYVASGNVLLTDLAKSEGMADWLPVAQILGSQIPQPPTEPYASAQPYATASGLSYPDPPDLNWGLVLLFDILTCGIFGLVWSLIQAAWFQKIRPTSKVLTFYIIAGVLGITNLGQTALIFNMTVHHATPSHSFVGNFIGLATWVVSLLARFTFRSELEQHYNGPEPVGLRLGFLMTFFFSVYYFQYHFNRINQIKLALRYRGTAL